MTPAKILLDLKKIEPSIEMLSTQLSKLNLTASVGTINNSSLGKLPTELTKIDRRIRLIYQKNEISNAWMRLDVLEEKYRLNIKGMDALDSDLKYIQAVEHWIELSYIYLEFLNDISPQGNQLDSITSKDMDLVALKYAASNDRYVDNKIELLHKVRKEKNLQKAKVSTLGDEIYYVDLQRIEDLRSLQATFDTCKLVRLCEELNICFSNKAFFATAMLLRSVLDHIPPVFECKNFSELSNNFPGPKSFKSSMKNLQDSSRNISDATLHLHIRKKESLPAANQVDFKADLDVLLAEVHRILR
ncbi:hypothetical protein [Pseudomonas sp. 58(2021)]|uniref:hypothetical protein n=1 Tax=Pseudomonas sp. 58(2021) TaxID=2813330 RepID=UPI001A9F5DD3|nr:hypothetical protein [Pseudomonas sp. 58(2021)]